MDNGGGGDGGKQNLDGRLVGPSGGIVAAAPNSCGFKSKLQQVCVCVCAKVRPFFLDGWDDTSRPKEKGREERRGG